eukprot:g5469.t1
MKSIHKTAWICPSYGRIRRTHRSSSVPIRVQFRAENERRDLDPDFVEALDDVSTKTLNVILNANRNDAETLFAELDEMKTYLLHENDDETANFISVLQGLLKHRILDESSQLKGPYLRAYNHLFNAVQGADWELDDGKEHSTSSYYQSQETRIIGQVEDEKDYYRILEVDASVSPVELKTAFRKLALKWHPDVNKDVEAEEKFVKIRKAYDVLSDPKSRSLYDRYGADGMESMQDAHAGDGNADRFWSEFKPFKKVTRKSKARDAATHPSSTDGDGEPQAGDLVEYPLSEVVKMELQDGRMKGVGLLVSRNKDRGDAKKLPSELLGLCEIEPLRQKFTNSTKWIPDEIGCSAFCDLKDLKRIPIKSYDKRFDVWEFDCALSEDCSGPEIVEEIVH